MKTLLSFCDLVGYLDRRHILTLSSQILKVQHLCFFAMANLLWYDRIACHQGFRWLVGWVSPKYATVRYRQVGTIRERLPWHFS